MLEISCKNCDNFCCQNPLTPVLLISEEDKFFDSSKLVKTAFREIKVLEKKENGSCVFLNEKKKQCNNYNNRPIECIIYPYLFDFSSGEINLKLDTRFCPSLHTLSSNFLKLLDYVRKFQYPQNWVNAYNSMEEGY